MPVPELATCRYQRFHPTLGAPIRTTVGAPRWKLPYEIAEHFKLITPPREILKFGREAYVERYLDMLEALGVERIRDETIEIADRLKASTLVFLCFEDLTNPDVFCHRRLFADWWTEKTGETVPEVGELRSADVRKHDVPDVTKPAAGQQLSLLEQARIQRATVR